MSANTISFCAFLVLAAFIVSTTGKLPPDVKACKPGDEECLIQTINKVIEAKYQGDDELNLLSIDPLNVDFLEMKRSSTSPVSVEIVLRNSNIYGYKDIRAVQVNGFGASPEGKHEIYFQGPSASLIGDYTIDGKVMILPIKGQGRTNLTLENLFIKIAIIGGSKVKDDTTYMDVKKIKMDFNTTRMHVDFSNLFDGDKALGENMNKFLNENWSDIFMELKAGFIDAIGSVITNIIQNVLTSHPYNVLFDFGN